MVEAQAVNRLLVPVDLILILGGIALGLMLACGALLLWDAEFRSGFERERWTANPITGQPTPLRRRSVLSENGR